MSARLSALLIDARVLSETAVRTAAARQVIYGGALDTALLEMGVITEAAIWARLAAATGLPVPPPALCDASPTQIPPTLTAVRTGPLRVVPVAADSKVVRLLCAEPIAIDAICAAAAAGGLEPRLYVVPEVRLLAIRQRIYGEPLPARFAQLSARILGAGAARAKFAHVPKKNSPPEPVAPPLPYAKTIVAGDPVAGGWDLDAPVARPPSSTTGRRLPPPPPPAPATSATLATPVTMLDRAAAPSADPGHDSPTPLEHLLDLSSFFPSEASIEVEVETEIGAQPDAVMRAPIDGPVRLDVVSTVPLLGHAAPGDAGAGDSDAGANMATEALCRRARDADDKSRTVALRALRRRLSHPAVVELCRELRETAAANDVDAAVRAIATLCELRDETLVPWLIEQLQGPTDPAIIDAARTALVALTAEDHGTSTRRWNTWLRTKGERPRVEWLLDGLGHRKPEIRMVASEDLRHLAGDSFGYLFDLPKRQRDQARLRFVAWWQTSQKQAVQSVRAADTATSDRSETGAESSDARVAPGGVTDDHGPGTGTPDA
jgi:hypothetical protein